MKRVPKATVPLEDGAWNTGGFWIWSPKGERESREAHVWRQDGHKIITACGCSHDAMSNPTAWGSSPTCKACREIVNADYAARNPGLAAELVSAQ